MLVVVTSDSDGGTGVLEAKQSFSNELETFFKPRSYGTGLNGVGIVLMCRDPVYEFKQRVRLSKEEKILDFDVMLDWDEMLTAGPARKEAILRTMKKTVREVFARRKKLRDFDASGFLADFDAICDQLGRPLRARTSR
jgi:hypothetical protein